METRRLKKSRFLFYGLFLLAITAVFSMSASAVKDSTGLYEYKVVDGTAEITGSYLSYDVGAVTIPSLLDGYKVTAIGEKAFKSDIGITSIAIPATVTTIKEEAFYGCDGLKTVSLLGNVEYVGDYAFYSCEVLENIYLPDSITYIGKYAFGWCDELENVVLPQNLESLESGLFQWTYLKKLYIPEAVTHIERDAVYGVDEIYYESSEVYWSLIENIDIFDGDDEIDIHFNHTHDKKKTIIEATLKRNGKLTETCECGYLRDITLNKISSVKLEKSEFLSNGTEIKPVAIVKDSAGNVLVENEDYMVTTTEALIEPGDYDVNVDFMGNYSGSKTLTLKIYSPTAEIKLNTKSISIAINQKASIKAEVLPATAKQGVKFSSSDKDVAIVSSKGNVKGISKGTVNITITAADGKTETVKVKVCNVKLNATKKTLNIGQKYTLKISNSNYKVKKWKTSDKKIVAINQEGLIKGKAAGKATITAVLENGIELTSVITVKKASLSATKMTVYIYNTKALTLKNAATTVKWASSNKKIAKVNSKGVVTGVAVGTATITATCGGVKYTCKVTVKNQAVISVVGVNWYTDSAGGVQPQISVKNNTNKDIKYISFYVEYKNRFGDPAYCEFAGKYTQKLTIQSGLLAKTTRTFYWDPVMYNYGVSRIDINKAVVTFVDNTKKTVNINRYWYDTNYYY